MFEMNLFSQKFQVNFLLMEFLLLKNIILVINYPLRLKKNK